MEDIFRKACLLQIRSACWNGVKALESSAMEKLGDANWIRGRKHLIDPDYLSPIKAVISKARKFLEKSALPFPMHALTLVPKEGIQRIEEQLQKFRNDFWAEVDTFSEYYEIAREEAHSVLGDLFNETDYPQDIKRKFRFEWRYVVLELPGRNSVLPPELYKQEKDKFLALMEDARENAVLALREEFAGMIGHLVERLETAEDGKPKIIRREVLDNLNEFFSTFEDRNLFEDSKLNELVQDARRIANQAGSHNALKSNDHLRERIGGEMALIKERIDAAIEEMPRRKLRLLDLERAA